MSRSPDPKNSPQTAGARRPVTHLAGTCHCDVSTARPPGDPRYSRYPKYRRSGPARPNARAALSPLPRSDKNSPSSAAVDELTTKYVNASTTLAADDLP